MKCKFKFPLYLENAHDFLPFIEVARPVAYEYAGEMNPSADSAKYYAESFFVAFPLETDLV